MQVQQEVYIQHATQLEQRLMEGAYNKVLSAKNNVPDQSYLYFMDKLVSTVRCVADHSCFLDRLSCEVSGVHDVDCIATTCELCLNAYQLLKLDIRRTPV